MLDAQTKKRIDDCRDILVGKITDPKSQVEQITIALVYKFMDDMDKQSEEWGGKRDFFVGDYLKYSWGNILSPRIDAHEMLNLYAEGIEKMSENPNLKPLLRNMLADAYLPYRDPETLKLFLKTIDGFSYENSERLGDAYEYLLSVLGSQGDAGQFRTPRHIIDFIVEIIQPNKGDKILDPACGTAGFLISAHKHILNKNTDKRFGDKLSSSEKVILLNNIYGYDISPDMIRLSLVNLFLHGFTEDDLNIREYDSLTSEDRWNEYFDVVLANPPFMTPKGGIRPHNRFSIKSNRAEVLFVNYIMEHLTPKGKAGIVVPEGIIFQSGTAYKQLRKSLIEKYLIGVVSLPSGVFNPYSGVKTSILLLDRQLSQKTDKIFFGKVENDGYDLGKQRREIEKNDLPKIKDSVLDYINNLKEGIYQEHQNLTYVSKEEIINSSDIGLSFERYLEEDKRISSFKTLKLNSFLRFDNGYAFKSEEYVSEGLRIIRIKNVQKGVVVDDDPKFYPIEKLQEFKNFELFENDILISLTGNVGRVGKIKKDHLPALLNQRVCRVRIGGDIIDRDYLFNILNTRWFEDYCISNSTGSAQKNLSTKVLGEIEIPLPPVEVQKEIVEELEQYQKVIDGAKQVVDNYKPHINIDESWDIKKLSDISTIIMGQSPPSDTYNKNGDGLPLINGPVEFGKNPFDKTTINQYTSSPTKLCEIGDLILCVRGSTTGRINIAGYNGCIGRGVASIRSKDYQIWINYVINSLRNKIYNLGVGSTFPSVSKETLYNLEIPLPPIDIQNQIVKKLEEERQIVEGNKKLIKIYTHKVEDRINKIWGE